MKYYLIAGEASGDLHASRLMRSLRQHDEGAEFRFFGGDLMKAEGGECVCHFKDIAYMGVVPVLMHLPTILRARSICKRDIIQWKPDVVILVDYAGFNLNIARFLRDNTHIPIFYYISPKIWAWKEGRIRNFKRDVDEMFCIMPFEVGFFEKKHHYPVHYVGNPTANEVHEFLENEKSSLTNGQNATDSENYSSLGGDKRRVLALLSGSRMQEIKDNLPMMIDATRHLADSYDIVLAGAPSIERSVYEHYIEGTGIRLVQNQTYSVLAQATAALVTSGTATLETCCFNVPQVVLYKTPPPKKLARWVWDHLFKVKYISLVNLIADREVVPEMMADRFSLAQIKAELDSILPGNPARQKMLDGYAEVHRALGNEVASENAARIMTELINKRRTIFVEHSEIH